MLHYVFHQLGKHLHDLTNIPSPANPPSGCKFHTRCRNCMGVCKKLAPKWVLAENDHYVACHLYDEEIMAHKDDYEDKVEEIIEENNNEVSSEE